MAAADSEAIGIGVQLGWRKYVGRRAGFYDLQGFAAEFCVGSGPGLEAADAVGDVGGGARKIYQAIFFFQDRGESGLRVVLWVRSNRAGLQAAQSLDHEIGADGGEARGEGFGGVVGRDCELLLLEDVASVEAGVDAHGGDASDG